MNFKNYLKADNFPYLNNYILMLEHTSLDEKRGPSPEALNMAKKLGKKMGFRINPSDTIFDYLKRASKGINDLFSLTSLYLFTDIKDRKSRADIVKNIKRTIGKVDKKEVAAFLMQLDRASIGITAHVRHALMSLTGIEVTTYNQWQGNKKFIEQELILIGKTLEKMNIDKNSGIWRAFDQFRRFVDLMETK